MAPPIPEHMKRFTANSSRPARYRPGKAVPEDESSEDEEEQEQEQEPQKAFKPQRRSDTTSKVTPKSTTQRDEQEEEDEEGFVTDEDDDFDGGAPVSIPSAKSVAYSAQSMVQQSLVQASRPHTIVGKPVTGAEDEESGGSESEDESAEEEDEDESSSGEEAPQRKFQRPTFIKKTDRKTSSGTLDANNPQNNTTPSSAVLASHYSEDVAARRLAEAESLIKITIERDTAARLAGKKSWDDDDDLPPEALVDDTDGLDPEAEHSAWRLREMHRLKRDREAMILREKELEEIERRRNLTAEEREAEDKEFIAKQTAEKEEGRGKAGFLSKYHHKGAFFMDEETSERLAKRDFAGAKFADDVTDKSTLPEYMRIRDMTKLGKKGRTRYTDLKGQDTGRFGDDVKRWRGSGYENRDDPSTNNVRGVDERFLPDEDKGRGPRASGANASAVGARRVRQRSSSRSDDERYRRRRRSYSRSRSMSRSPPRKSRRQRSPSPYQHRHNRNRLEA